MVMKNRLAEVRKEIDEIDANLLRVLNRRASLAIEAAKAKSSGQESVASFYCPGREAEIVRDAVEKNPGPLAGDSVATIFREIISSCLSLEEKIVVAYLGPQGTYTEEAALKHFGRSVKTQAHDSIEDVFAGVQNGVANFGVVPVESAVFGCVSNTLDCFVNSPLRIYSEVELTIHHMLLSKTEKIEDLHTLYAHEQSIAQCREWLRRTLPGRCQLIRVSSNAEAAKLACDQEGSCAIAGRRAARHYGLRILRENIEDQSFNVTRFLVIGDHPLPAPTGSDKTSLLVTSPNRPGSLVELLKPLSDRSLSMVRIESRPAHQGPWEYVFFLDVMGHAAEVPLSEALVELKARASLFRLLGSYPIAVS